MVNVSLGHDVDYKLDGFVRIREDPKFKILQRKYWVSMFQNLYFSHLDQSCLATCATLTLGRTPLRRILPFLKDLLRLFHFISIESQHKCIGLVLIFKILLVHRTVKLNFPIETPFEKWIALNSGFVYNIPDHKNLFLEFPKKQGSFMLHFDL